MDRTDDHYANHDFVTLLLYNSLPGALDEIRGRSMSKLWTPEPEFTKEELFASIEAEGLHINDSLLQEFQEQGLMLPCRRKSKGRDGSDPGVWTQQQRDLLRSLCHARERQGMHSVALRCNLPVWVWLYWGDSYGVTLEQVKQVMKSWAARQAKHSLEETRQSARRVVQEIANAPAGGKRRAVNEVADLFYEGRFTAQDLSDSLHHVFDQQKKPNGPHDIPFTPEAAGEFFRLRWEAIARLRDGQDLPDIYWQWARFFHLHGLSQYLQEQPKYAQETAGGPVEHLFSPETITSLYTSSCVDLAMILSIGLRYPDPPRLPEWLRLAYWKRCVKSATCSTRQVFSPLVLPGGPRLLSLAITGMVTLWAPEEHRDEPGQSVPKRKRARKSKRPRRRKQ